MQVCPFHAALGRWNTQHTAGVCSIQVAYAQAYAASGSWNTQHTAGVCSIPLEYAASGRWSMQHWLEYAAFGCPVTLVVIFETTISRLFLSPFSDLKFIARTSLIWRNLLVIFSLPQLNPENAFLVS